ncbi:MAG: hypothetical protein IPN13_23050 [Bacteroidetes bacterium]|nr:hypothetical protein [Bacteroidota bacterium]
MINDKFFIQFLYDLITFNSFGYGKLCSGLAFNPFDPPAGGLRAALATCPLSLDTLSTSLRAVLSTLSIRQPADSGQRFQLTTFNLQLTTFNFQLSTFNFQLI